MFESTDLLIAWTACTWLVATVFFSIYNRLQESNTELVLKLHRHLDDIIHRVHVEKYQDTYYWYDIDDHKFLAQGASEEEIIARLKSRFPTHMFFLPTNHVICAKTEWRPKIVETNQ